MASSDAYSTPCVIEDEAKTLAIASSLVRTAKGLGLGLVFKASYDKANRSSSSSYRGPGIKKGLSILAKVKEKLSVPVLTDVHCVSEVREAAKVADILQIPALLCRQEQPYRCLCPHRASCNVKKGQFIAPEDVGNIISKIKGAGGSQVILTERGVYFGYHDLVVDFRSIPIMKKTGYPVIFDATHSVQTPQGAGSKSGGKAGVHRAALDGGRGSRDSGFVP